jgi:protein tyrosine/serine phosphatase
MKHLFTLVVLFLVCEAFPTLAVAHLPSPEFLKSSKQTPVFLIVEQNKLYRGGHPTNLGLQYLKQIGVRTILSVQGGDATEKGNPIGWFLPATTPSERVANVLAEKSAANRLGLTFVWDPMAAMITFDKQITAQEDLFIDQALKIMNDKRYQPIYLHCSLGKDRAGLLVALYRVMHGWSVERAHQEWIDNGHSGLNGMFTQTLDTYFYEKVTRLNSTL